MLRNQGKNWPTFLGHNAQAVRWQVWTALLVYLLLRLCAWLSQGSHDSTRRCCGSGGAVAAVGPAQPARTLRDTGRRRSLPGHDRAGLIARLDLKLWNYRSSSDRHNREILKLILPLGRRFFPYAYLYYSAHAPVGDRKSVV